MLRRLMMLAMLSMTASLLFTSAATAQPGANVYNCSDFDSQEQAQLVYNFDTTDPNGLDADGDGIACETLGGGTMAEDEASAPEPTPAPTEDTGAQQVGCDGFASQFGAQQFYDFNATPEEQAILDPDGNGFACDSPTAPATEQYDAGTPPSTGTESYATLPDTGGPSLLLPFSALLIGAGILGLVAKRRASYTKSG